MRLSPQRRLIFRHQNFKKCSDTASFLAFSLENALIATAACISSTSELQKVLRHRQFFSIFTSKCALRHSGVQFLISPLSTYLRTRRFNRPTFRLTRHTNHWKNTAFRDLSNIWRGCIFFLLTFALLHLLSADLTTLLCLSTVHIVGSLLFKLPSINTPVESVDHKALGICHSCFSTKCFLISLRYAVFSFAFTLGQIGRGQGPEPRVDRTSWKQVTQKCQSGSNKIFSNT